GRWWGWRWARSLRCLVGLGCNLFPGLGVDGFGVVVLRRQRKYIDENILVGCLVGFGDEADDLGNAVDLEGEVFRGVGVFPLVIGTIPLPLSVGRVLGIAKHGGKGSVLGNHQGADTAAVGATNV